MTIDCGTFSRRQTSGCDDCVVTFIVEREPNEAVVIDVAEFTALRRLARAQQGDDIAAVGVEAQPAGGKGPGAGRPEAFS